MSRLRQRQKELRQQVIAEAAYELLSTKPYHEVTVDDIARKAGCGKGTLYLHFENKDHILTYLLCERFDELSEDIENKSSANPNITEAIYDYMSLQYEFYRNNHQIIASWVARRLSNKLPDKWINQVHDKLIFKLNITAHMLEKGMEQNIIIKTNSYDLADYLENIARAGAISYIEGLSLRGNTKEILLVMKNLLTNGIFTNPPN